MLRNSMQTPACCAPGLRPCASVSQHRPASLRRLALIVTVCISLSGDVPDTDAAGTDGQPNILLIMADDLGFSDLGCYGSEIETPNLDSLAANGLRFTQFYNTARCWPTRAALLTGYYAQQVRRDSLPGIRSGGRGTRPDWAPLLPRYLAPVGYRSYHSGKWHIDGLPIASGFDRSYYLKDQGRFFSPKTHWEDDVRLPEVPRGSGYYGTVAIASHAIKCLQDHARHHASQPFFHYLVFTAPHFPLHALPADIARYRRRYVRGWEAVRNDRFERQVALDLLTTSLSEPEHQIGPPYHFPEALKILGAGEVNRPLPWQTLTALQREFQAAKMAIHAAMIDRIDQEIGRVLTQLRDMQAFDNTLIFFLSDNGASAEIMVRNDGHDPAADPGSAASYLCLGPGWSTTANTPFRRHKTWVHEGGISTPLVVHWPAGIPAGKPFRRAPGHVIDIVPTILDVADATKPDTINGQPLPDAPGRSLRPLFAADDTESSRQLWWLHEDNRAIRSGNWKLVAARGDDWELFNLQADRSETTDLAAEHPEKVRELSRMWQHQFTAIRKLATPSE